MKNKMNVIVASIALFVGLTASYGADWGRKVEGSGYVKLETRDVTGFTEIISKSCVNVKVKQAADFQVEVEADDNLLKYITTKVEGNQLIIEVVEGINIGNSRKINVLVSLPKVDALTINGSGNITVKNKVTGEKIYATIMGSGNISMEFDGKTADATIKGSGNLDLSGNIETANYKVHSSGNINSTLTSNDIAVTVAGSGNVTIDGKTNDIKGIVQGSGNIDCFKLLANNADVRVQGSGNINVQASEKLIASVDGSGEINYNGNAVVSKSEVNGSGKINKK